MNNVIAFLEKLGKSNNINLDGFDMESLLQNEDFDPNIKEALIAKDNNAIEMLLNRRSKIVCLIIPAEPDDDESEDDDSDNTEISLACR